MTWREIPIGARVVLRYRLHDGGHPLTDALGDLIARDETTCTVATRRGEVTIPVADIVAAKPVPPAPPRRPRA